MNYKIFTTPLNNKSQYKSNLLENLSPEEKRKVEFEFERAELKAEIIEMSEQAKSEIYKSVLGLIGLLPINLVIWFLHQKLDFFMALMLLSPIAVLIKAGLSLLSIRKSFLAKMQALKEWEEKFPEIEILPENHSKS